MAPHGAAGYIAIKRAAPDQAVEKFHLRLRGFEFRVSSFELKSGKSVSENQEQKLAPILFI